MKMKSLMLLSALVPALLSCGCAKAEFASYQKDVPFSMPVLSRPSIPSRSVSILDYGGVGDGTALNTEAFAAAIGELSRSGGGRLVVPAGIWKSGPITLLSGVELHLEKNALLVFDPDQDLYPIIDTNFEGLDVRRCLSPINALGQKNIAITGEGIIDGSGEAWREVKKAKVSSNQWKSILARGGVLSDKGDVWFPDEGYKAARATAGTLNFPDPSLDENFIKTFLRPVMISLRECENVLLEGCTFQNSPCWNIHPLYCKNLIISGITVRNPAWSANGDGIDIDACENVLLVNSSFDVGDDAICIKSGKDADGRRHARKCRNLVISGCTVYHGHGGFVVGSEMSGGVENILVRDCIFNGTDVGLRFKSTRGRGGVVRDIWCENILMKDIVTYGVIFNLYYEGVAATDMNTDVRSDLRPVDETTPEFRDIHVRDILCAGAAQSVFINGLPEMPVRGVDFHDCKFVAAKGRTVNFAEDIVFDNVIEEIK